MLDTGSHLIEEEDRAVVHRACREPIGLTLETTIDRIRGSGTNTCRCESSRIRPSTVMVTILQQNCHEFISYEGLLDDMPSEAKKDYPRPQQRDQRPVRSDRGPQPQPQAQGQVQQAGAAAQGAAPMPQPMMQQQPKQRPAPLDLVQAVPLVERALEVLERRAVQPQLGLLKSTMLQLNPSFSEKAYGAHSFSEFVEMLKRADYVHVTGSGGRYMIERKRSAAAETPMLDPDDSLQLLRDVLENHRLDMEDGVQAENLQVWVSEESPQLDWKRYGFQEFNELLNFAQDRTVVRVDPDEVKGLTVYLGAEFYPPAMPPLPDPDEQPHEYDERQPFVAGQPTIFEPDPKPVSPRARKRPTKTTKEGGPAKKRAPAARRKNPN